MHKIPFMAKQRAKLKWRKNHYDYGELKGVLAIRQRYTLNQERSSNTCHQKPGMSEVRPGE